jgi:geranylgeranyl diphosphate synthase type I
MTEPAPPSLGPRPVGVRRPDPTPRREPRPDPADDPVVLLDARGRPSGTIPKGEVHHAHTPLHLAFSCHVVAPDGRVLLTRRAATKNTWPATWSNACCGHPRPGETLRHAVERRLRDELGVRPCRLALAVPDFVYRATMPDGPVEHELCPVVVAEIDADPQPDPAEVDGVEWTTWEALRARATDDPASLSPWSVAQIARLAALATSPHDWLDAQLGPGSAAVGEVGLDRPAGLRVVRQEPTREPGGDRDGDPVATVRGPVERTLALFLAARRREAADLHPAIDQIGEEISGLVAAGGKRLRPAFAYWGHRATGAAHDDGVVEAGAALELLHTFALLHDDVMDRSDRRRDRPTAHRALAARHRSDHLDGDDAWFGTSAAILAGDLAFLWSNRLLDEAPAVPEALTRARAVFQRLCTEVIGGQYLDLRLTDGDGRGATEPGTSGPGAGGADDLARHVALLKSARYTVTRPLQLGAALGDPGRAAGLDAALAAYGDAVGLAFQLRDDVLGLFGDPAVTGKSRLDDLRAGKHTLLVVRALGLAPAAGRRVLAAALGDPGLDDAAAERCREVVASSGALASVEALIAARQDQALRAVRAVPEPARSALEALAALAADRDR